MQFRTIYIPYEGRAKYQDLTTGNTITQGGSSGSGTGGGGNGTTQYLTAFETEGDAGAWSISNFTALSTLENGTAIMVRFHTDSNTGLTANTIDLGIGMDGDTAETHPYPIYLETGKLVTDEIKAGDELMLVFRENASAWTIDASNERYARDIWEFYNSGTVISKYHVASSGDVMSFGEADFTGFSLSVIDNFDSTARTDALSANKGKELNDRLSVLETSAITQIKTINGISLIGPGNVEVEGGGGSGGTWSVGSGITYDDGEIKLADYVFETLDNKYDKTGGYVSGSVIASGDVVSYGMSDVVPTGLSVIDNLNSNSSTDALSAKQGKVLNGLIGNKQDTLVSGTNIKTINGNSILGSGNLVIEGGGQEIEYTGGKNIYISNHIINVAGRVDSAITSYSALTSVDSLKLGGSAATLFVKTDALDLKYDKTGGTVSGTVHAVSGVVSDEDVIAYGASSVVPTGLTVIDRLDSESSINALSARQGKVLNTKFSDYQPKLVSGTNIKTINGQSLLGSGNLEIEGGGGPEYFQGSGISIANSIISISGSVFQELHSKLDSGSTASDSNKLAGSAATDYAKVDGNYQTMKVGSATTATYSQYLGTENDNYTKSSIDAALGAVEEALDMKYDKTGGYVSGTVIASGDVLCYGAESVVPTGLSVIDNLTSTSATNALSANQGRVLNGKFSTKQDTLVSGTNIKTINGLSLLGSGNIDIEGGGGTEYFQGSGISISNNTISVTTALFNLINGKANTSGTYSGLNVGKATSATTSNSAVTSTSATTSVSAITATNATNATYATNLGNSTASYTKSSLDTALAGKLGTGATAADSSKLGGVAASGYLTTGGTAADSNKLGGTAASGYAKTGGTYASMTVGNATNAASASTSNSAVTATSAKTSTSAVTATSATTSVSATTSTSAKTSTSAVTAGDSAKLGGSAATVFAKASQITQLQTNIDQKYDKTGGTITGSVAATGSISATGDVMSYGASSVVPAGFSVINSLTSTSVSDALSANQGRVLNTNKQDKLVSGTNIKTINNQSILGSGNIVIEGGGAEYQAGTNISISNNTISVTGRVASASTCLSASTATSSTNATNATNATYATNLGNSTASYTKSSLDTALAGKLGTGATAADSSKLGGTAASGYLKTGATAADSSKLGGVAASGYLTTGGTAADSSKLGGTAASGYAKTGGTYASMTVGNATKATSATTSNSAVTSTSAITSISAVTTTNATNATYATNLGNSTASYTKSSLDTALAGKLGTAGTAADSSKLGGVAASSYARTSGTYNSMTVGAAGTSTYASRLGDSSSYYTYSSIETALSNKLGTGDTAADSSKLGGVAASSYAKTNGSYSSMYVGTAGSSTYAGYLGTSTGNYTYSTLNSALSGKLGTGDTAADSSKLGGTAASGYLKTGATAYDSSRLGGVAASGYLTTGGTAYNSTRWGGYKIVVGSIGSDSNTIYFGY